MNKKVCMSITTDDCCTPLIMRLKISFTISLIPDVLVALLRKEENFLARLRSTETPSRRCICQKIQSNSEWLTSSPFAEAFLSWWKWNLLRMIVSLLSGHWKVGWKWKQCHSFAVVVTTTQLKSASWCGTGNSTLHNYQEDRKIKNRIN